MTNIRLTDEDYDDPYNTGFGYDRTQSGYDDLAGIKGRTYRPLVRLLLTLIGLGVAVLLAYFWGG